MQLTVLIDNISDRNDLEMEHGLSFHIDKGYSQILFDTGQSAACIRNAEKTGIDISQVDFLVLSHGHYDHAGGIKDFMRCNTKAKIILSSEALQPKFSDNRYIGLPKHLTLQNGRTLFIEDRYRIDLVTEVIGNIQVEYPEDTHYNHFYVKDSNALIPDTFRDEVFLTLRSGKYLSIVTGCSHNGITNIIAAAHNKFDVPVKFLFGGFHLMDSDTAAIKRIAGYVNKLLLTHIVTGHCTGMKNYITLKNNCNARLSYSMPGSIFTF